MKTEILYIDEKAKRVNYLVTIGDFTFNYHTGFFWVTPKAKSRTKPKGYDIGHGDYWVQLPRNADILQALYYDYCSGQISFYEFCDNYGYDRNSRKDLDIYFACMDSAEKISKLIRARVLELDQDYDERTLKLL